MLEVRLELLPTLVVGGFEMHATLLQFLPYFLLSLMVFLL